MKISDYERSHTKRSILNFIQSTAMQFLNSSRSFISEHITTLYFMCKEDLLILKMMSAQSLSRTMNCQMTFMNGRSVVQTNLMPYNLPTEMGQRSSLHRTKRPGRTREKNNQCCYQHTQKHTVISSRK